MEVPTSAIPQSSLLPLFLAVDTPPDPSLNLNDSRSGTLIGVSVFLIIISTLVVALRLLARYLSSAGFWWDDWTCLAALVLSWGVSLVTIVDTQTNGFGQHEAALGGLGAAIDDTTLFFKIFFAWEHLYTTCIALCRLSMLLFYSRIFTERLFRLAVYALGALSLLYWGINEIVILAQCRPIGALWDGRYGTNCIDLVAFFTDVGIINVLLNVAILCLPVPMIWGLEIEKKAKWGLIGTFMLGAVVIVASIARTVVISGIQNVDVTCELLAPLLAIISRSMTDEIEKKMHHSITSLPC